MSMQKSWRKTIHWRLASGILFAGLCALRASTAAEDTIAPDEVSPFETDYAPTEVVAGMIGELSGSDELQVELRGARDEPPNFWPASFYVRFSKDSSCTGSIVGEQVVLMAAHCIAHGGILKFKAADVDYVADCSRHDAYRTIPRNYSADYALCRVRQPVRGVKFERLNIDSSLVSDGTELLLTGFGCTTDAGTGGQDDVYRVGEANVTRGPVGPTDNYFTTEGKAALCFGDSGGPAFLLRPGSTRVQVSVNARVGKTRSGRLSMRSFLSSTSTPDAIAFLKSWSGDTLKICGIHSDARGCR
jgi:Trypsin